MTLKRLNYGPYHIGIVVECCIWPQFYSSFNVGDMLSICSFHEPETQSRDTPALLDYDRQ